MTKVTCFLPCRAGSQRVPNKNTKPFGDKEFGLVQLKLEQLSKSACINEIVLSTNDAVIINFASKLQIKNLRIDIRADNLCSNETSTDDLIQYVPKIIDSDLVLWTHVTSPFFTGEDYDNVILKYTEICEHHDSMMGVKELRSFIWNNASPINYDRTKEKWPRTQTLLPLYEVDSSFFLAKMDAYTNNFDRIGFTPFLYVNHPMKSFDIDWPEDFEIAESFYLQTL